MKSVPEIEAELLSDRYFEDPYRIFGKLYREAPVYWSDKLASWLVVRYDDCERIVGDAETFSSAGRVAYLLDQLPEELQPEVTPLRRHYSAGLAHSDPPVHTRLRGVLRNVINPAMARERRERVRSVVVELLDGMQTGAPLDFIREFAYPLPATVVADVLGAPRADIGKFKAWADDIAGLFEYGGKMTSAAARRGVASLREIRGYILGLLDAARGHEDETVIGVLANPRSPEEELEEQEIISTLVTLFVAGHETTTNLLGLSLKALIDDPDLQERLRADPSAIPAAVRELLRYETIVPRAWRMATRDVQIRGQDVRRGEMVMAMLGAANRDPAEFDSPDRLDVDRRMRRNLGFGSGIHICLGAPLARVEGEVAIEEILKRYESLAYADEPYRWRRDMALRGLQSLPVVLTAA